jgi:hypothetical protein
MKSRISTSNYLFGIAILLLIVAACQGNIATDTPEPMPILVTTLTIPIQDPTPTIEPTSPPESQVPIEPATCEATAPDQLGPFYIPGAPVRSSVGVGHQLHGVVLSVVNCAPISAAQIEFWQVGPNGEYDDDHRATLLTDADGGFAFESNFPPPYSGRPPHIHMRVSADGYETLVTQYYPQEGQSEGTFDLVLNPVE